MIKPKRFLTTTSSFRNNNSRPTKTQQQQQYPSKIRESRSTSAARARATLSSSLSASAAASTSAPNQLINKQKGLYICSACDKPIIKDKFLLKANDKYWHENCLKCDHCHGRLGELGSTLYIKSNMNLCRQDYLSMFGKTGICSVCEKLINATDMAMKAKQNVYHLECFACQLCNQRFCVGDRFYLCENKVVCQYDYEEHILPIQRSLLLHQQHHNHLTISSHDDDDYPQTTTTTTTTAPADATTSQELPGVEGVGGTKEEAEVVNQETSGLQLLVCVDDKGVGVGQHCDSSSSSSSGIMTKVDDVVDDHNVGGDKVGSVNVNAAAAAAAAAVDDDNHDDHHDKANILDKDEEETCTSSSSSMMAATVAAASFVGNEEEKVANM